jgi:cardiolipin synthase C
VTGVGFQRLALGHLWHKCPDQTRTSFRGSLEYHGLTGSSGSSLHAETFSVDRARLFIGSFNFDSRSARLKTEMGFLIESPTMAETIAKKFTDKVPARAYMVRLSHEGTLQWVEHLEGKELVRGREPCASL